MFVSSVIVCVCVCVCVCACVRARACVRACSRLTSYSVKCQSHQVFVCEPAAMQLSTECWCDKLP